MFSSNNKAVGGYVKDRWWVLPENAGYESTAMLRRSILNCMLENKGVDYFVDSVRQAGRLIHGDSIDNVVMEFSDSCFDQVRAHLLPAYKNAQTVFKQLYTHGACCNMNASYHVQTVKYSDKSSSNYLIVNLKRQVVLEASVKRRSRSFWKKLVIQTIEQAAKSNKPLTIGAPIVDFNLNIQVLDHEITLYNTNHRFMAKTPQLEVVIARIAPGEAFNYVNIIIKPQDK